METGFIGETSKLKLLKKSISCSIWVPKSNESCDLKGTNFTGIGAAGASEGAAGASEGAAGASEGAAGASEGAAGASEGATGASEGAAGASEGAAGAKGGANSCSGPLRDPKNRRVRVNTDSVGRELHGLYHAPPRVLFFSFLDFSFLDFFCFIDLFDYFIKCQPLILVNFQIPPGKGDGVGGGLLRADEDVERFQPSLKGVAALGHFARQVLPLPLKLEGALPGREPAGVAHSLPAPTAVHQPARKLGPAFQLAVVLPQPPVQVHRGPDVRRGLR